MEIGTNISSKQRRVHPEFRKWVWVWNLLNWKVYRFSLICMTTSNHQIKKACIFTCGASLKIWVTIIISNSSLHECKCNNLDTMSDTWKILSRLYKPLYLRVQFKRTFKYHNDEKIMIMCWLNAIRTQWQTCLLSGISQLYTINYKAAFIMYIKWGFKACSKAPYTWSLHNLWWYFH